MPTIELNEKHWGRNYAWPEDGDEWSRPWGGTEAQWWWTIVPRIHTYVPVASMLEIAPGFGRWTQYLKELSRDLTVVDLNANCIQKCKERFGSSTNITYHVNDGTSLAMIPDNSIDMVFSFDSLVHVEFPVLEAYVNQLAKKLTPDGVGFFHHSNIGTYSSRWKYTNRIPKKIKQYLTKKGILNYYHLRAFSVTAARFEELCNSAGLCCISQEMVNWRQRLLIDVFSVFTHKNSKWVRPNRVIKNYSFMEEAKRIQRLSSLYGSYRD
jgi:ubiquinone/menaquinone biosynthesis C-methylase UbiE